MYLLTYLLTPWSRVLLENLTHFQVVKKFPIYYWSRRFITAFTSDCHLSYPEPAWSSPYPTPHFLKIHLNIIPPIYAWVFQVVSFSSGFQTKPCICLSSPLPISFVSIWSPEQYWVRRRSTSSSLCRYRFIVSYSAQPTTCFSHLLRPPTAATFRAGVFWRNVTKNDKTIYKYKMLSFR